MLQTNQLPLEQGDDDARQNDKSTNMKNMKRNELPQGHTKNGLH